MNKKTTRNYSYHVAVFCAGNNTQNEKFLSDAQNMARGIAERNFVLVNGASSKGLMGATGRAAHEAGGDVYGIGLKDYEPEIHGWFSNWEGFCSYSHRMCRLTDLADIFIALAGGLGTLHEVLDVHIKQLLGKEKRPIILISPIAEMYKDLCDRVKDNGLYWDELPESIHFAKDADEALLILDKIVRDYDAAGYVNKNYYPALTAKQIYDNIRQYTEKYHVLYAGLELVIHPDVYPPNRFRSSCTFAKHITKDLCEGKVIFDIGCGPGNLGILGALNGAEKVISVDINPVAVENTKENASRLLTSGENIDVREGSVFDAIGEEKADVIFFHPPFHRERTKSNQTKLINAFSTDGFTVLNKFFEGVNKYLKPEGKIYLGFSNKDPQSLNHLEGLMRGYSVSIIAHKHKESPADYRLYSISLG